ncbi:MAG: hypothetical protein QW177_08290 [Candidatus Nitrosotenuis sp.]
MKYLCICALFLVLIPAFAESDVQTGSNVRLSGALLDRPFDLHLNETTLITSDNILIKFLNVTNDSRCPSGVQCMWRGGVRVEISIRKENIGYGGFGLELGGHSSAEIPVFDKYFIQLLKVEPHPKRTHKIQPGEYVATFIVKKTKGELLLSPLQQLKAGTPIDQIQCREGFVVAIKASNGNPVCVTYHTGAKLIERGWAKPI